MVQTNPRENLRRLLDGGVPDWIPFTLDIGAMPGLTEPIRQTFRATTGADDPAEYFDTDIRRFSLKATFGGIDPAALHDTLPNGTEFDEWGNGHWAGGAEGTVDELFPALASAQTVQDVEALPLPKIETDVDTSVIDAYHQAGYPVFGYAGSIYEWSWWVRGMEQFWVDLLSDVPLAEAIIEKITAHTTQLAIASARIGIDVLCFYDDAGMQQGMQIAPDLWRRMIKPAWQRVLDAVRCEAPDARFFLHSCGKIDPIVPDIVELGFHILHPVQPECMDFARLYREYGKDIVLAASLSSQRLLPFGTPEDVRREVFRLAEVVGSDRRCLLMPSNAIQPETPRANVVALVDAARSLRPSG
ncbi:MAG: hypothetical protein GXP27_00130 [Planctomycetes bacterium]|nr:hypothetical protein [Planctomycetota bacterium]